MANFWFQELLQKMWSAEFDIASDTIRAVLYYDDFTPNAATHRDLADIPSASRAAIVTLSGVTVDATGALNCDDAAFSAVPASGGKNVAGVILFKNEANEANALLIGHLDQLSGFPLAPNGGPVTLQWPNTSPFLGRI